MSAPSVCVNGAGSGAGLHRTGCRRTPVLARRRVMRSIGAACMAVLLAATIVYGEHWVLEEAPAPTAEGAAATFVVHALDSDAVEPVPLDVPQPPDNRTSK